MRQKFARDAVEALFRMHSSNRRIYATNGKQARNWGYKWVLKDWVDGKGIDRADYTTFKTKFDSGAPQNSYTDPELPIHINMLKQNFLDIALAGNTGGGSSGPVDQIGEASQPGVQVASEPGPSNRSEDDQELKELRIERDDLQAQMSVNKRTHRAPTPREKRKAVATQPMTEAQRELDYFDAMDEGFREGHDDLAERGKAYREFYQEFLKSPSPGR
ncbi:hypothetical protein ABW21_db0202401 [Orbilia brochopaga]|nr:hypothetical protein ABW21_db0202401 [Drechslerella brochopaga]